MKKTKKTEKLDTTTEQKIKDAARTVFIQKGFAATRTRDIAEEAGINLALLNYYFRSKGKLFEIIMIETLSTFIQSMMLVLNNEKTTLEKKVEEVASRYIDLIILEPELPTFIVTEVRSNPQMLINQLPIRQILSTSFFFRQHREMVESGKISEPNPLHFLMNMLSLIIFPFVAKPLLTLATDLNSEEFNKLMQQRKKLIPVWVKAMMETS